MPPARAIVATSSATHLAILNRIMASMSEVKITAHAPGLMELFSAVETDPPDLVMVSDDLVQLPDFESLCPLFDALDVQWLRFRKNCGHNNQASDRAQTGGASTLLLEQPSQAIRLQLKEALAAKDRPNKTAPIHCGTNDIQYSKMVLLGASTGGVDALKTVLSTFDRNCPPTMVVQHTTQRFGKGLPSVLSKTSQAEIVKYEPDTKIRRGRVYILAGEDRHVVLAGRQDLRLVGCEDPPMSGHRPSIDKLFLSAVPYAKQIVAAVLTGMGQDGAKGLLALRNAGARTLAQDKSSSVVFGMPGSAWSTGGAEEQVPLSCMGETLLKKAYK